MTQPKNVRLVTEAALETGVGEAVKTALAPGGTASGALSDAVGEVTIPAQAGAGYWNAVFAPPIAADLPVVTLESTASGATTVAATTDPVAETHFLYGGLTSYASPATGYVAPVADFPTGYPYTSASLITEKSDVVEVRLRATVSSSQFRVRVWVDGQPVDLQMPVYTIAGGATRLLRLTFPEAKSHRIMVEWADANLAFGGVVVGAGQSVYRPAPLPGPKVAFLGDSFVGGAHNPPEGATRAEVFAWYVAALMCASDWRSYGHGGTGYVATDTPYSQRVPLIAAWQPDIVVVFGSVNDVGLPHATVRNAALDVLSDLDTVPRVYVTGPSTQSAVIQNEAVREAANRVGVPFLDGIKGQWTEEGDIGADGTHPTFVGHQKLARGLYGAIRNEQNAMSMARASGGGSDPVEPPAPIEILTEGSMFLVEPGDWATGVVPANGDTMPNKAWTQAAAALGSGTEATLAAKIVRTTNTASTMVLERTAKGGLHGIFSQTTTTAAAAPMNGIQVDVSLPDAVRDYIAANPTDNWYISSWSRITRPTTEPGYAALTYIASTANNANGLAQIFPEFTAPTTGAAQFIGGRNGTNTTGAPQRRAIAIGGWTNTVPASGTEVHPFAATWGNSSPINRAIRGSGGSWILYRVYVENLTKSGRSFAQVEAIDAAQYSAAFGAGGKYAGDTFSDPAVLVP